MIIIFRDILHFSKGSVILACIFTFSTLLYVIVHKLVYRLNNNTKIRTSSVIYIFSYYFVPNLIILGPRQVPYGASASTCGIIRSNYSETISFTPSSLALAEFDRDEDLLKSRMITETCSRYYCIKHTSITYAELSEPREIFIDRLIKNG